MAKFSITQRQEILEHAACVGVTQAGISYLDETLNGLSRPSGEGGLRSFGVEFASALQGCTIQAESATVELKYLLNTHLDPANRLVLEQPPRLSVRGKSLKGRNTCFSYTPDFLEIGEGFITGVECKSEEALRELVDRRPGDYRFADGCYHFLPAETKFSSFGMSFKVFSDVEVGSVHFENLMLLCPLQQQTIPADALQRIQRIREATTSKPRSLHQLRSQFGSGTDMAVLYGIANSILYGCVKSTPLTEALRTTIFSRPEPAAAEDDRRQQLDRAERLLTEKAWAKSAAGLRASDLLAATRRLKRIAELAPGQPGGHYYRKLSTEVARRIEAGEEPELAAATRYARCGNRGSRVQEQTPAMLNCYKQHIAIPSPKSKLEAHGILLDDLSNAGLDPVSYTTWRHFIAAQGQQATALAQSGARGFQAHAPRTDEDCRRPLATTAGQIVHVDSTPEDCRMFAEIADVISLERPCFALAVCESTNFILGIAVAFGNASRFLLALLLRDIIRRWGFYPPWIVNDGGPEHRASMWRNAAAWNRTSIIRRPIAAARAGAPVENAVRYVNNGVLRKLSGSTRNDEANRSASNETKSRATAVHEFKLVQKLLIEYVHNHMGQIPRGFAHGSPRDLFESDRALRPIGTKATITDPMALIETAVPIKIRKRDFDPTSGIRVGHRNYRSNELLQAASRNRSFTQVRLDPEDPSQIYVQYDDGWVRATSHDARSLKGLSDIELLVEGMHTEVRWEENTKTRTQEQLKVNRKIDELEASARARATFPDFAGPAADAAPPEEDLFAKFAADPKTFKSHERG